MINLEKSEVSFSRNLGTNMQEMLREKLNVTMVNDHEKYLGLPTYVGRSKKKFSKVILDRVCKKSKGMEGNIFV